jgi:hypothetical protein
MDQYHGAVEWTAAVATAGVAIPDQPPVVMEMDFLNLLKLMAVPRSSDRPPITAPCGEERMTELIEPVACVSTT